MGEAVEMNHLDSRKLPKEAVINLDHGDPRMYETYWRKAGEQGKFVIPVWQTMSYFSDPTAVCWFLEPEFAVEVERVHRLVGNAKVEGKYIVVGNGSSQLYQAALYALAAADASRPTDVVSSVPYYSPYPMITSFLRSGLYQWAGDAKTYKGGDGSCCIEVVCSPNNPDGFLKEASVKTKNAKTIHDLAYYWPQYAAISHAADHDIMLFTFSKCTGHAGTRIGWAVVKDREVAKRMTKYIELNTIGVSKDSQLRAAKLLGFVSEGIEHPEPDREGEFFTYARLVMTERWRRLREVVRRNGAFSLPDYPSCYCRFSKQLFQTHPAFAWMRCEKEGVKDCAELLKNHKMLTRGGVHFGVGGEYVRISLLDRDPSFELFLERISSIEKGA